MANSNFVVQNGLTVGSTTIFAGNGDVVTSGNISVTGGGSFVGISSSQIYQGTSNVSASSSYVNVAVSGSNVVSISSGGLSTTGNLSVGSAILFSSGTINAAGTNQGTATLITADNTYVTGGTGGVILPVAVVGREISITNNTGTTIVVYPASGASIEQLSANAGVNVPSYGTLALVAKTATNWWATTYVYLGGADTTVTQTGNGAVIINDTATLATVTSRGATTSVATSFTGGLTASQLTVTGNLTVNGTQTTINNTTVETTEYVTTVYANSVNAVTIGNSGAVLYGTLNSSSASQTNITAVGTLTGLTVAGTTNTQTVQPSANVTYNIGSTTAWYNTIYGTSTHALYADLAEKYTSDKPYAPGTVLMFGGTDEVTLAAQDTTAVAGIVSTNPAHLMNGALNGPNTVALALLGRVPCQVIGPIKKGDMLISAGFGFAKASAGPVLGQVVGKALENFDIAAKGIIEVVVGRL